MGLIRWAMRTVRVRVLPVPGPARSGAACPAFDRGPAVPAFSRSSQSGAAAGKPGCVVGASGGCPKRSVCCQPAGNGAARDRRDQRRGHRSTLDGGGSNIATRSAKVRGSIPGFSKNPGMSAAASPGSGARLDTSAWVASHSPEHRASSSSFVRAADRPRRDRSGACLRRWLPLQRGG